MSALHKTNMTWKVRHEIMHSLKMGDENNECHIDRCHIPLWPYAPEYWSATWSGAVYSIPHIDIPTKRSNLCLFLYQKTHDNSEQPYRPNCANIWSERSSISPNTLNQRRAYTFRCKLTCTPHSFGNTRYNFPTAVDKLCFYPSAIWYKSNNSL